MLHAFSDANHGSGDLLFQDYYRWYLDTLNHVRSIKDVVWIIKPHPSSCLYGEEGIAESTFYKSNSKNIYLCPSDMSTASVFNIATAVVTVRGTVAIEAACMGVPSVLAGEAPYAGFGYTHEPNTQEEYFQTLSNIRHLKKLTSDQINNAKKVLYLYNSMQESNSEVIPKFISVPGKSNDYYNKAWHEFFQKLVGKLSRSSFYQDSYYHKIIEFLEKMNRVIEL